MKTYNSHYDYIDEKFKKFVNELPVSDFWKEVCESTISADGDKCYGYKHRWEAASVPFNHGVCIYLISKMLPYSQTVRNTSTGWVDVCDWVIKMYHENGMKQIIERIEAK